MLEWKERETHIGCLLLILLKKRPISLLQWPHKAAPSSGRRKEQPWSWQRTTAPPHPPPPGTSLSPWPSLSEPERSWDSTCHTPRLSSPTAQVTESWFPSQMSRMSNPIPLPFLKHPCLQSPVRNASSCPKHACNPLPGTQNVCSQCGFPLLTGLHTEISLLDKSIIFGA